MRTYILVLDVQFGGGLYPDSVATPPDRCIRHDQVLSHCNYIPLSMCVSIHSFTLLYGATVEALSLLIRGLFCAIAKSVPHLFAVVESAELFEERGLAEAVWFASLLSFSSDFINGNFYQN